MSRRSAPAAFLAPRFPVQKQMNPAKKRVT